MHPTIYHHPITGLRLPLSKLMLLRYVCPSFFAVMTGESFYRPRASWPQTICRTTPHNPKK
ncbi:hypothetical protein K443DRAFT_682847 [Laccaria amethystina LaAM-08-1]|uniref:Uncharacterized protein n=1 Tax=Laccaria amethystina LaAM-08-1 TaxID=1095629 RepID=A0A0C9XHR6_9AGAR|nr:hypothetical protein K443DRAFT_682847 [Laccaria amethystina LaAM-08-1]